LLRSYYKRNGIEAGCDEAGRGCLSGPVFAAAVILPKNFRDELLNDSKQLNDKQRKLLRPVIEKHALAWAIAQVSVDEIDKLNILQASFLAMHKAIEKLNVQPELLLIDGNRFIPYKTTPHVCIIKGDCLFQSIAAASILAKTYRDDYMDELHGKFPQYNWLRNKGYGTLKHRAAIAEYGPTEHHRKSFRLLALNS
jgi:ribonuclease HII